MAPKLPTSWVQLPPAFLLPEPLFQKTARRSIQSIFPPRPNRFNVGKGLPILTSTSTAALQRKAATLPLRTGALATKKGMSAIYDTETGERITCTILQMDRVQVVSHKTRQRHGYFAVQVGCGWKHPSNVTRPELGHFAKNKVSP